MVEASPSCCGSACEEEEEEEEDKGMVSMWDLGGGVRPLVWGGGARCWQEPAASGLVLWSAGPGTGPSVLGAGSGAWSPCSCCCCLPSGFPLRVQNKKILKSLAFYWIL